MACTVRNQSIPQSDRWPGGKAWKDAISKVHPVRIAERHQEYSMGRRGRTELSTGR